MPLFRSFLPAHNPIGFGAADFIELVLACVLLALTLLWSPRLADSARRFARHMVWCMLLLAVLPVALRLALLRSNPIPAAGVSDDFSYLLLADTLRHGRLANPAHALPQFFETFFVLQEPTYSSIFPLGQGLVLALGWTIGGHPWVGVALSIGAFCALCYWMLRGWTTAGWALIGGLLAVIQFGPLNQWMNSYWGGAVSASAGCLVFGALPRLRESGRTRDAVWLGLGIALQLLTRPFECVFLLLSVLAFFLPLASRRLLRPAVIALLVVLPAVGLTLVQNRQVTGHWTTLPYMISRYQYGVPATFTFQPNPVPHRTLTAEERLDYEIQSAVHGSDTDSIARYLQRLLQRVRFYRFFFLPPLYLAMLAFVVSIRRFHDWWVLFTLLLFAAGTNFYPYFYSHYIAAVTCLFLYVSVSGLEHLARFTVRGQPVGELASRVVLCLCAAHFLFWYGIHLLGNTAGITQYESWDAINSGDPEGRIAVNRQLANAPGKQLVFVRYGPRHTFQEWVHNAADIDASRVVWARDLGASENQKLLDYYRDRTAWLLEPDAIPPKLQLYQK